MSQIQHHGSDEFPLVAFQEDHEQFDSFFTTLRQLGWRQASLKEQNHKLATYDEIMLFFVKVYALLAATLTSLYLMTFILLITKQSILEKNQSIDFRFGLYLGSLACTVTIGMLAYFFEKSREFPINLIYYVTFTIGAAYVFGNPLAMVLQEGFNDGKDWIILLYLFTMTIGSYACIIIFLYRKYTPLNSNIVMSSIVVAMLFLLFIFIMTAPYYVGILIASFACNVTYGYLLIVDTRLIISGKFSLTINQYMSGALYLYLDITVMIVYFIGCILYAILKATGYCCKFCCDCLSHLPIKK